MSENGETTPENSAESPLPTAEIPFALDFSLGRQTMTLRQLEALSAGFTFRLASAPEAPVELRCGGSEIGRGRLVSIEGGLGVQVVSILDTAAKSGMPADG